MISVISPTGWLPPRSLASEAAGEPGCGVLVGRLCWAITGALWIALLALAPLAGFKVDLLAFSQLLALNLAIALLGLLLRARGWPRAGGMAQALAQVALSAAALTLLTVVAARSALPLRDEELAALDLLIGFDPRSLVALIPRWPTLTLALNYAYASMHYQLLAVVVLLFLGRGTGRDGPSFVLAWIVALVLTLLLFPLVPALGWYLHFGITREMVPDVLVPAAWLYVGVLDGARDGTATTLGLSSLDGVVTFPSFHAAAAVLLAWGFRRTPVLRHAMVAVNALMLVSTVAIGGHYIVDGVAGVLVAAAAILISLRVTEAAARRAAAPRLADAGRQGRRWPLAEADTAPVVLSPSTRP